MPSQNDVLTTELRKTEAENGEYEAYMTKKTVREQTKILTLTDKNNAEIDAHEADATRKAAQHERMTKELKDTILERESELEQTRRQVADLSLVQKKRDEQQKEIEQLEATIEEMNKDHFDSTCSSARACVPACVRALERASEVVCHATGARTCGDAALPVAVARPGPGERRRGAVRCVALGALELVSALTRVH